MELAPALISSLAGGTLKRNGSCLHCGASIPDGSNFRENHFAFVGAGMRLRQGSLAVRDGGITLDSPARCRHYCGM